MTITELPAIHGYVVVHKLDRNRSKKCPDNQNFMISQILWTFIYFLQYEQMEIESMINFIVKNFIKLEVWLISRLHLLYLSHSYSQFRPELAASLMWVQRMLLNYCYLVKYSSSKPKLALIQSWTSFRHKH